MNLRAVMQKHSLLILILIAAIWALAFQGARGLLEPDEGRYSNVSLQILQHGDWISLYRNQDSLHFTKPPVTYWSIAASVSVFGHNEWAVRLPMALAFVLSVFLTYQLGRVFVPSKPWLPALFLLGSPLVFFASNTVNTDGLLAALLTLAMACFAHVRFGSGRARWLDVMWLAFGLAFLTKGPPALLPILVVVIFDTWHQQLKSLWRPIGLLAFAVVGFTWYGIVIYRHPGLIDYFLGHEVYARIATDDHHRNGEWYGALKVYGPTFLLGLFPWLLVLCKQKFINHLPAPVTSVQHSRFLWLWLLVPLSIFCLSKSRLPLYILGLFVPVCLLLARRLEHWKMNTITFIGFGFWLLALLVLKGLTPVLMQDHQKDSRAFAVAIQPLLPGHPNQIIFVDDMTRNGLNLYFQSNIKKVSFTPQAKPISDAPFDLSLPEELARPADQRIFIMKREREADFLNTLHQANKAPIKLGEWIEKTAPSPRDRMVYTLQGEFPPH